MTGLKVFTQLLFMAFTTIDRPLLCDYSNRKICIANPDDNKPLRFQIPRMYIPFGISGFKAGMGPTKWDVQFSMKGWDEDGNYVNKFYNFLKGLEEYVVHHVYENRQQIFGKDLPEDEIRGMFNSNIKDSGGEPKFRVKVDTDSDDNIKVPIFDSSNNEIGGEVEKGLYSRHSGVAIVEMNSVYFMNKMFGITWKLHQLKIYEPQRLKGFQFVGLD